ncbi:MAG: QueT transporter family protein [Caldiserica bacterium]|nr:QueT transporter family protein [Caldisericota bacterium]
MNRHSTAQITRAALIAAMYIVFTMVPPFSAISYGAVQFRLGEALVLLPFLLDEAVLGVVGWQPCRRFSSTRSLCPHTYRHSPCREPRTYLSHTASRRVCTSS